MDRPIDIPFTPATYNKLRSAAYEQDCTVGVLAGEILAGWRPARMPKTSADRVAAYRARQRAKQDATDKRNSHCLGCGGELPAGSRLGATYCTNRCRQRAYRDRLIAGD